MYNSCVILHYESEKKEVNYIQSYHELLIFRILRLCERSILSFLPLMHIHISSMDSVSVYIQSSPLYV